jgi:hypothetical protein
MIDIREFDGGTESRDCAHRRFAVIAGCQILTHINGEFRFRGGFFPAGERYRGTRWNHSISHQKTDKRSVDMQSL